MNLDHLKRDWEHLAQQDALWAILTDGSKAGGKWDLAEFLATGEAEITTVMDHLASVGVTPHPNGVALDFGCGVGRLTQALARRFKGSVGVDIADEMIQKANALNRYDSCSYVANKNSRLPFEDASFSFIYSNIVLQHMPARYAKKYLREFVRVLAPKGVFVFGVQDSSKTSVLRKVREAVRVRSRLKEVLGLAEPGMKMFCLSEIEVRKSLGAATILDIQFTNTAAADFNGKLVFFTQPPLEGYVGKQYCVIKDMS